MGNKVLDEFYDDAISRACLMKQLENWLKNANDQNDEELISVFMAFLATFPSKKFTDSHKMGDKTMIL